MTVYMQFWDLKACNLSYKVLSERNVCTQSICCPLITTNMFGSELLFNALLPTHTFFPLSSVCGNFILLITNDLMFLYFHTSKITAILICPESVKFFWFGSVTFQAGNTSRFPPPGVVPSWCLVVIQPINGPSTSHCLWVSTLFVSFFFTFLFTCFLSFGIQAILFCLLTKFIAFANKLIDGILQWLPHLWHGNRKCIKSIWKKPIGW